MMTVTERLLLCTDLDRTVLPNGPQPESPDARPLLRSLARRPEITLVYVSGRDQGLLCEAIEEYQLPLPDFAIGDVGTTVYEIDGPDWRLWQDWHAEIAPDWHGQSHASLAARLEGIDGLQLQEPHKQGLYKLSYYAPPEIDALRLQAEVRQRLAASGLRAGLVWSLDEMNHIGLLDVLPAAANKLHAIRFLMRRQGFDLAQTVFAGDSGNDLPVLVSEINAVLVANAIAEVREQALREARAAGLESRLYFAQGGLLGMNGNYAAGVLEGLVHFRPEVRAWLA